MKKVNVLMCTYNGEKYLRAQIDSILNQSYENICLYVRDDGSTDSTMDILREYEASTPGKVVIIDSPKHLGYPDCFWDILVRCPEADLYAFSDQDDVWAEDKIESVVEKIGSVKGPALYIHDYDNCDGNLKLLSHHRLGSTSKLTDRSILFYTFASGFCMTINDEMKKLLNPRGLMGLSMYHDELCIWAAHFYGQILYDDKVLTKYRRHESTVTEYGNGVKILISNWLRREIFGSEFSDKCERIRNFLRIDKYIKTESVVTQKDGMPAKARKEWALLSEAKRKPFSYFRRLFYPARLRPSIGGEMALRLMFLLGKK